MKRFLFIVFFWTIISAAFAQQKGDTLYVAAPSGLSLRNAPGTEAIKTTVIPPEAAVIVVADVDSNLAYAVTEFPGFTINGYWLQVSYQGQTGYAFSGYLSSFKPFEGHYTEEGQIFPSVESKLSYLWKYFELPTSIHDPQTFATDTCYNSWQSPFDQGITYRIQHACGEGGGSTVLEFENHSLQEVYLFFLLYQIQINEATDETMGTLRWDINRKGIERYYEAESGAPWSEDFIYPEGNKIIWINSGGC